MLFIFSYQKITLVSQECYFCSACTLAGDNFYLAALVFPVAVPNKQRYTVALATMVACLVAYEPSSPEVTDSYPAKEDSNSMAGMDRLCMPCLRETLGTVCKLSCTLKDPWAGEISPQTDHCGVGHGHSFVT